jgi:ABC-type transporter Mla subunit MlaD
MAKKASAQRHQRPDPCPVTRKDLEELFISLYWVQRSNTQKIMAKLSELSAKLTSIDDQLDKAQTEITGAVATLQQTIDDLKAQIEAGSDPVIPDEAQAALDRLTAVAQALDDLNPDAVPNPGPVTPPSPTNPPEGTTLRPKSKLHK